MEHCPFCLRSRHVDIRPGDRRCGCRKCGFIRANRIAGDDNEALLLTLAALPMSQLPFPAARTLQLLQEREIGGGAP